LTLKPLVDGASAMTRSSGRMPTVAVPDGQLALVPPVGFIRFIDGDPMKVATNVVAGFS